MINNNITLIEDFADRLMLPHFQVLDQNGDDITEVIAIIGFNNQDELDACAASLKGQIRLFKSAEDTVHVIDMGDADTAPEMRSAARKAGERLDFSIGEELYSPGVLVNLTC